MRYILRNQDKIFNAFGQEYLSRMKKSLDRHFNDNRPLDLIMTQNDPYQHILVEDVDHTTGVFEFYVVKKTFDVYKLAYKGAIG